jgi:hypothetical protein
MASRAERACIPARYVGLGAQEALEAAIRRFFELYDRLRGKRKGKPRRPTNHLHAGRLRDRLPGQAKPVDADGRVTARVAPNARAETPPLAATPPRRLQTSMGRRPPIGAGRAPPCPESVGMRSVPQRRRRNLAQSLRGVRRPPFHPRRRLRRCRPAFAFPRCPARTPAPCVGAGAKRARFPWRCGQLPRNDRNPRGRSPWTACPAPAVSCSQEAAYVSPGQSPSSSPARFPAGGWAVCPTDLSVSAERGACRDRSPVRS